MKLPVVNTKIYAHVEGLWAGSILSALASQRPAPGTDTPSELPLWAKSTSQLTGAIPVLLPTVDLPNGKKQLDCDALVFRAEVPAEKFGVVTISITRDCDPSPRPTAATITLSRNEGADTIQIQAREPIETESA